jgi:hypothetical protein
MSSNHRLAHQTEQLQAVLACLDLSLESELALYRRQHHPSSATLALAEASPHHPDLEVEDDREAREARAVRAISEETKLQISEETRLQQSSLALSEDERPRASRAEMSQNPSIRPVDLPDDVVPPPVQSSVQSSPPQTTRLQDSETSKAGVQSETLDRGLSVEEDPESLPEPYKAEAVSKPEALERFLDPSIDDYLESSEALLKHLDRSEEEIAKPTKASPLKSSGFAFKLLGGILVSALIVGTAMTILKQFSAKSPSPSVPQPSGQPSPPLNFSSPSTSASLEPSADVSSKSSSTPNSPATIGPQPAPSQVSSATASPLPTPSAAIPSAAFYVVVAPYQGVTSFQRAKQLVPDAFIANVKGQRLIQLSFVENLQQAQRLVSDLKNEGFSASIVAQN